MPLPEQFKHWIDSLDEAEKPVEQDIGDITIEDTGLCQCALHRRLYAGHRQFYDRAIASVHNWPDELEQRCDSIGE